MKRPWMVVCLAVAALAAGVFSTGWRRCTRSPDGPSRDAAVGTLIEHLTRFDPETAFLWAETIQDDKMRKRRIERVVRTWKNKDREAAEARVRMSDIPDEEKERLLRR